MVHLVLKARKVQENQLDLLVLETRSHLGSPGIRFRLVGPELLDFPVVQEDQLVLQVLVVQAGRAVQLVQVDQKGLCCLQVPDCLADLMGLAVQEVQIGQEDL